MSISPNILKEVALENAMLYDGMVDIFNDSGNRLMSLVDCFIYELQYAFMSHSGSLNISFFIELDYEYRLGTGPVQRGSRKLSVSRSCDLGIPLGEAVLPARYHFLPVVSAPSYEFTLSNDRKSLYLKIFTDIKVYFTEHYFTSLYRCMPGPPVERDGISEDGSANRSKKKASQDQMDKQSLKAQSEQKPSKAQPANQPSENQSANQPSVDQEEIQPLKFQLEEQPLKDSSVLLPDQGTAGLQPVSWASLLESVSPEDALTILEHFMRLLKMSQSESIGVDAVREAQSFQEEIRCSCQGVKCSFETVENTEERAYAPMPDDHYRQLIDSQNERIRQMEEELSNRGVLIDKLLRLNHLI